MRSAEGRHVPIARLAAGLLALCAALANASPVPPSQAQPPAASAAKPTRASAPAPSGASPTTSTNRPPQPSDASAKASASPSPQPPAGSSLASQQAPESAQAGTAPASGDVQPAIEVPQPFLATYAIEWRGMGAGTSSIELTKTAPGSFRYQSRNHARGIFKIALPGTIMQTSELSVAGEEVRPLVFTADDGSSNTERDVSLKFDWDARRVTGTAENEPVDIPIEPGVQDPGSVQIALMRELAAGRSPTSFMMIDKNEVKEYQYKREGEESVDTALGKIDTVIYTSQRTGSSRLTRLWIAPSLGYVPVRGEQMRKGKREFTLQIRTLQR
jgi:hypothetical protein